MEKHTTSISCSEPLTRSQDVLGPVASLEKELLGFRRDPDHAWLSEERQGYVWSSEPVGYDYLGQQSGPFSLLNRSDFPAVLGQAEGDAAAMGGNEFSLEVLAVNTLTMGHWISRGFRLDTFLAILMSDEVVGKFEDYLLTSPYFFL